MADIQKQEAMLVQEITVVRETDQPQAACLVLLTGLAGLLAAGFILRRI